MQGSVQSPSTLKLTCCSPPWRDGADVRSAPGPKRLRLRDSTGLTDPPGLVPHPPSRSAGSSIRQQMGVQDPVTGQSPACPRLRRWTRKSFHGNDFQSFRGGTELRIPPSLLSDESSRRLEVRLGGFRRLFAGVWRTCGWFQNHVQGSEMAALGPGTGTIVHSRSRSSVGRATAF